MSHAGTDPSYDVIIVGAGAVGIGGGGAHKDLRLERFTILNQR